MDITELKKQVEDIRSKYKGKSRTNWPRSFKDEICKWLLEKPSHQNLWVNGGSGSLPRA